MEREAHRRHLCAPPVPPSPSPPVPPTRAPDIPAGIAELTAQELARLEGYAANDPRAADIWRECREKGLDFVLARETSCPWQCHPPHLPASRRAKRARRRNDDTRRRNDNAPDNALEQISKLKITISKLTNIISKLKITISKLKSTIFKLRFPNSPYPVASQAVLARRGQGGPILRIAIAKRRPQKNN